LNEESRYLQIVLIALVCVFFSQIVSADPPGDDDPEVWVDGPGAVSPGNDRDHPDVAVDPQGRSVYVWGAGEIYLRRFDRDGNALEDPVQVNTTTDSAQTLPRIAMHEDGSFLVVWQSREPEPVYNGAGYPWIRTQAFDANAQPIGGEQLMYSTSTGAQNDRHADVAALPGGGYVVVWAQGGSDLSVAPDTNRSIMARLLSSNGTPNGDAFVVNSTIGASENDPTVTELDDGGFLVAWELYPDVFGRRFNAAGEPVTDDYQLSTRDFTRRQSDPDLTRGAEGRILLVWAGPEGSSGGSEVWGRMFSPTLDPLGDDFQINALTEGVPGHVRVSADGLCFLVVWESPASDGEDTDGSIQGRFVTGNEQFDGPQFQINQYAPGGQYDPAVGGRDGVVAVAWGSGNNASSGNDDVITGRSWLTCGDFCEINDAIGDAWFNPLTNGQGFFIVVWEQSQLVYLSWFTFDSVRPSNDATADFGGPGQRWVTALGPYDGDTATLDVYLSTGGVLDSEEPPVFTDQNPIGTITIKWTSCNSGVLTYDIPSLMLFGTIPIERIVQDKVPACEAAQP